MDTITRKSLLYKTGVEYGDYTINHVQGCSHGCTYPCYAFSMAKRFGKVKTYDEWVSPKLVSNTIELLKKEIPKYKNKIQSVQLCFTTDPFMCNYPEVVEMSLKIIDLLQKNNIKVTALTKGILPKELIKYTNSAYGITLVSLDEKFRNQYEPGSSKYKDRIESLYYLHKHGLKTWVSIEPYPTPNIINQSFEDILNSIKFVDKIIFGRLHYNKLVSQYKDYKKYYNELARKTIEFCEKNNIQCHIKDKTITN